MKISNLALVAVATMMAATAQGFAVAPSRIQQYRHRGKPTSLSVIAENSADKSAPTDAKEQGTPEQSKSVVMEQDTPFENKGLFSWMAPFLAFHEDGKSMAFGVPVDAASSRKASPEEIAQQKRDFASELMNIGMEERERRQQAGEIFTVVTALYFVWASLLGDQGDFAGHLLRFGTCLPLFFALGFRESAERGLWNIAQAGRWEIDGTIQPVDDPRVASAILNKVNQLNLDTGLQAVGAAAALAVLPQSTSSVLALFAVLFAGLYFVKDKIPSGDEV